MTTNVSIRLEEVEELVRRKLDEMKTTKCSPISVMVEGVQEFFASKLDVMKARIKSSPGDVQLEEVDALVSCTMAEMESRLRAVEREMWTMVCGVEEEERESERSTVTERGDDGGATCCLGSMKPPSIILRNMILPKDLWPAFPRGLNLSVSDYFLYQPGFPTRANIRTILKPSAYDLQYEEVWLTTKDHVDIYAFLIKTKLGNTHSCPTLIFFHGNAGSIGDRLENVKILLDDLSLNIFLVEYRGYGPSKGVPSERGLYRDAKAAFRYVTTRSDLDARKIFVFGRSLGGAVAIHLASRKATRGRLAGVIVENSFTSVPSIAKKVIDFPGIRYLPRWFYNNKFDNKVKVGAIVAPALFISSENDEIVPAGMMHKLYALTGSDKKSFAKIDAGHNDAFEADAYTRLLHDFIQSALSVTSTPDDVCAPVKTAPPPDGKISRLDSEEDMWEDILVSETTTKLLLTS